MATILSAFPRPIREIENQWITLQDGCKLAARMWLPVDADENPVPAILEYLPYRKRDGTAGRDALTHPYFAGHGYACLRVDMRGNGESDGLMWDEYLAQEQDDALEVIAWIRAQSWCTGRVGMIGISWGGFNGLQVAARAPDGLDAVVTIASTVDRYHDDIHYKGGCLLLENLGWSSTMQSYSSRPPDPMLVGEKWRQIWAHRLAHQPLLIDTWLGHQRRDAYWQHGSVVEDYSAIKAAVLSVGGWGDGYRNTMDHLARHLTAPVKAIAGPWVHKYPHFAKPGPQIGFLQECLRWWDRWLKDSDTGVEQDPAFRAYMMESARPATDYDFRQGRWISEAVWPPKNIIRSLYHLSAQGLVSTQGLARHPGSGTRTICSPQTTGIASGEYSSFGSAAEWPGDQRIDDAGSLVFDSQPLDARIEIFGGASVDITVTSDQPQANLVVRLIDLAPDGAATRISFGMLNLCHRDSHENPQALVPGTAYRVQINLDQMAYAVPAGHQLRLSISTAYWPFIWPSPRRATITVDLADSTLQLPIRPPTATDPAPVFGPVEHAPPQQLDLLRPAETRRRVEIDQVNGRYSLHILNDSGCRRDRVTGLETSTITRECFSILPDDPLSAIAETWWTQNLGRGAWQVRTEAYSKMTATAEAFVVTGSLHAYEGDSLFDERHWHSQHPRDFI